MFYFYVRSSKCPERRAFLQRHSSVRWLGFTARTKIQIKDDAASKNTSSSLWFGSRPVGSRPRSGLAIPSHLEGLRPVRDFHVLTGLKNKTAQTPRFTERTRVLVKHNKHCRYESSLNQGKKSLSVVSYCLLNTNGFTVFHMSPIVWTGQRKVLKNFWLAVWDHRMQKLAASCSTLNEKKQK